MILRRTLAVAAVALSLAAAHGCRYYSNEPPAGLSEADIKKMMEADPSAGPVAPRILESTAEETMETLSDSSAAEAQMKALKNNPRRMIGKVLEKSAEGSETPFLILDGGTHRGMAYKVKCIFPATEGNTLKEIKAGDEVRVEGKCESDLAGDTLELKNCVLAGADAPQTPAAPKTP